MNFSARILAVLFIFFLVGCGSKTADSISADINFIPHTDDALGVSLVYPENWIVKNSITGLTIASSQSVIDSDSLSDIGNNGFVVVIPGELDVFNFQTGQEITSDNSMLALSVYQELLAREGQSYQPVEPPQPLEIDAGSGTMTVLRTTEDGKSLITVMAVIINDDFMALVSAASLESTAVDMRPIFDKIIQSIQVMAPAGLK